MKAFSIMKIIPLLIATLLILSSCGNSKIHRYSFSRFLMNTYFEIILYTTLSENEANKKANETFAIAERLEEKYSATHSNSILYLWNNSNKKKFDIDKESFGIISDAIKVSKDTSGAFDITVYPLIKVWGFLNQEYRLPSPIEIKDELKRVNYKNIVLKKNKIILTKNTRLDLGGILKGYAVDRMVEYLSSQTMSAGIVNAGGNLKVFGTKPDNSAWNIGIRHPRKSGEIIDIVNLKSGESISTSGDYERFFITNSIRYHHILNPKNGYPVQNGCISVSVISSSAELSDAYSTAFFVMGKERAFKLARKKRVQLIVITEKDGVLEITNNFK